MDSPIFRQQNQLRNWLTGQPQVTHRKLSMLGALRILPLALEKPTGVVGPPTVLWTTADSLEHDQRCLAIFRAAITGTTAAWDENPLLDHAAKEARENLRKLEKTKSAVLRTTSKAASIFKFAALVNSPDIQSRDRSAKFAAFSLEEGWTLLRDVSTATEREEWQDDPELAWDVAHNVELLTPSHLRLFNVSSQPAQSNHTWETFCTETGPHPSPWQFWHGWYQGMLGETPTDWDLQLQVALIEDAIWDAGPETVAAEIDRIKQKIELEKEIAELKAQLHRVSTTSGHPLIGDNGGPPLDAEISQTIQKDLVLVWDELIAAEEELAKPAPEPSVLSRIAKTLWKISLRLAKYCGQKLDVALTEAAKAAGKACGVAVVTVPVATQYEGIQSVAKALWAFARTLLGS